MFVGITGNGIEVVGSSPIPLPNPLPVVGSSLVGSSVVGTALGASVVGITEISHLSSMKIPKSNPSSEKALSTL